MRSHAPAPRITYFDALWAGDGSSNENVVTVYIGFLRKKMLPHDFGFEIKTIRNQGFVLQGIPPILATHLIDQSLSLSYKIRVVPSAFICQVNKGDNHFRGGKPMAWTKPIIREFECGMEINMYGPDSDEEREDLF